MPENKKLDLILVCGPNGAGKSTFTRKTEITKYYPVVDADQIAKENNLGVLAAGKEVARQIKDFLENEQSFVRESTLTSKFDFKLMKEAKQKGYRVTLVYVGLDSKERSMNRVKSRHQKGGHDIPREDILRRYDRSLENLIQAIKLADKVKIIDNSETEHRLVAEFESGKLVREFSSPEWFKKIKN